MNENTPGQEPESAAPTPAPESTPKSSQESASESATTTKAAEPAGPPYVLLEKLAFELLEDQRINRLRKLHPNKPVYVVVEDMCASGCYYIAAAADRIYVSQASIVGSIGVLMSSFGFTGLMDKLGIERRLMTAGENKALMDPFSPYSPKHKEFTQAMLKEIHEQFIDAVRAGRGKRLKENPEIFSGLFWTGSHAITLGLADGLGTVDSVARDVLKAEDVIDYTVREGLSDRVLKKFGAAVGEGAARALGNEWLKPR